jgi:hypothetical protein
MRFLAAILLIVAIANEAAATGRGGRVKMPPPCWTCRQYQPFENPFGPGRSGVAPQPSTSIKREAPFIPPSNGARTGGVHD